SASSTSSSNTDLLPLMGRVPPQAQAAQQVWGRGRFAAVSLGLLGVLAAACLLSGSDSAGAPLRGIKTGMLTGLEESGALDEAAPATTTPPQPKPVPEATTATKPTPVPEATRALAPQATAPFHAGWPCELGEEIFFGQCFVSCKDATVGAYPYRQEDCTCCKELPCITTDSVSDCVLFGVGAGGVPNHPPLLTNCPDPNEELYRGLCYTKCGTLTNGYYPLRTGMNTCSNFDYGGNWTMGFGVCSGFGVGGGNCLPHIPTAAGVGSPGNARSFKDVGQAPMGFTKLPVPNRVAVMQAEITPEAAAAAAAAEEAGTKAMGVITSTRR
ncbi:unnamed protein product, partial [Polarella glacialis]